MFAVSVIIIIAGIMFHNNYKGMHYDIIYGIGSLLLHNKHIEPFISKNSVIELFLLAKYYQIELTVCEFYYL